MKQNRILSFALAVVSFGLIFLYGSLAAYARAYVARTFRVEASLPGELLPILPGLLLAWTFQGAPLRRPRFSPANFLIYALLVLLSACALQGPTGVARTPTPTVDIELATSTPIPQTSPTAVPTSSPEARASEYRDTRLCFSVKVPTGWTADGVRGGFAWFAPATGQSSFNITNVALEETTLAQALDEVQRGPLASYIQEVQDFVAGDRPALWVTFAPGAQFLAVVLVIAPDCGDGPHALFISATKADQRSFETFLGHIRFI